MTDTNFNLLDAIQGRSYPSDSVTLYLDVVSGRELSVIEARLSAIAQGDGIEADEDTKKEYASLERKAKALAKKITASAVRLDLRGVAPSVLAKVNDDITNEAKDIDDKADRDRFIEREWTLRFIAPHIIRAVQGDNKDERLFTTEDVQGLQDILPPSEWDKLDSKVGELSLQSAYFDAGIDAGFLPKS